MINYAGMKAEENRNEFGQLPAGVYVAKVLSVSVTGDAPDQSLAVLVDVAEGEYKDFYMKKYEAALKAGNTKYGDPKFKGVYRLRIPNPANTKSQYPESDVRRMNDMIFRFEKSNAGFHWDGDEQKLKNLTVGINVQEDSYNGNAFTRIGRLEIADDVRRGIVKAMAPRNRQQTDTAAMDQATGMPVVEDVELPF